MDGPAMWLLGSFIFLVLVMLYRFLGGPPLKRRRPKDRP
jgi:hypothetical protein